MRLSTYIAARSYTPEVCLHPEPTAMLHRSNRSIARVFDTRSDLATHNNMDRLIHSLDLQPPTSAFRLSLNFKNP